MGIVIGCDRQWNGVENYQYAAGFRVLGPSIKYVTLTLFGRVGGGSVICDSFLTGGGGEGLKVQNLMRNILCTAPWRWFIKKIDILIGPLVLYWFRSIFIEVYDTINLMSLSTNQSIGSGQSPRLMTDRLKAITSSHGSAICHTGMASSCVAMATGETERLQKLEESEARRLLLLQKMKEAQQTIMASSAPGS